MSAIIENAFLKIPLTPLTDYNLLMPCPCSGAEWSVSENNKLTIADPVQSSSLYHILEL